MDEFVVYVLLSKSSGRTYTGMTSDLITRFHFHNSKSTKGYTIRYRPWIVIHVEFFQAKREALLREKELESGRGREWLRNHVIPLHILLSAGFISATPRRTGAADTGSTPPEILRDY
ncbi:putative endonuclease [Algoriphagus sp. 4150]|uniref:GIY-YIG nuclease family protein n=1 Tax=Algoriphagus sp. 4150 TaxID=2817756 RepID=UPI002858F34D|nr:GIY-YIG nuclease family protein [Algoriphagus sp. 4150]MDR7130217.1 putative endonuclease [Algoriphagus sp. 4150]